MVKSLLSGFFVLISIISYGQFTSVIDGNWNNGATWGNASPGTAGVDYPASISQDALIGSNVTIPAGFSAVVRDLYIQAGFLVTISNTSSVSLNGVLTIEDDGLGGNGLLDIFGTLQGNQGSSFVNDSPTSVQVYATGKYTHNFTTTAGNLLQANWATSSTCEVVGYTSNTTAPGNLGQTFYNFIWNCPNGTGGASTFISLGGSLTTVAGNLTVTATGGSSRTLRLFDATSNQSMTVGGNVLINGSSRLVLATTGASNTLTISGDLTIRNSAISTHTITTSGAFNVINVGGNFLMDPTAATTVAAASLASGSSTINVVGNFTMNPSAASIFSLGSNPTAAATLNLGGNFSANSNSTISSTVTAGGNLVFNGSFPAVQTFSNSGTISTKVNYKINNGATLDVQTSALIGTGSLTLSAGGTLKVGSPNGLATGTTTGNIRVSGTRTYTANANIIYNGAVAQLLGNEWGTGGALNGILVNLEIANVSTGGVTNNITGSTNLVGTLTLTSGSLNIGNSNSLGIQNNFVVTGGTVGGDLTSNLTFGGSGSIGTLTFTSGSEFLNNLTVSRTGTVVLGSNLTVNGLVDLSAGNLNFTGRTLTINGSGINSSGTGLRSTSATNSNLIFGGSSYSGTVPFTGAGNTISTLSFATPGGAFTWNSPVTITTSVTLSFGTLTHTSGLTMAANSTFIKGGGTFSGAAPSAASSYNVTYVAAVSTGLELPTAATALRNLKIDPSSGTVTLTSNNISINGDLILTSGTFSAGSNTLTMKGIGSNWAVDGGSFSPGSGTVNFTGTTLITSTANLGGITTFNNINVSNILTLPTLANNVSVQIQGNVVNSGTINPGTATTTFSGTTIISGVGSTTFNTILISGSLAANSGTTIIIGDFTNNGTFNSNNGQINFNGSTLISGSSTTNLFGVSIGTSSTLTAPSGILGIAGNFANNGTFNNNSGTVNFNGTVLPQSITGSPVAFNHITVSNSVPPGVGINTTVRLNGALTLTSSGIFDADGVGSGIFIVSSTSQIAGGMIASLPTPANLSGNVTVERYIHGQSGGDYRYLSSPITNGNVNMLKSSIFVTGSFSDHNTSADNSNINDAGNTNPSIFTYDGTSSAYVAVTGATTASTPLSNTTGYAAYDFNNGAVTASYRGTVGKGPIAVTISSTASNFNLVPNPYPSPIDWDNVTKTNVNNAMYLRIANNVFSSYVGGVATNPPFVGWTGEVAVGQSFFVTGNGGGTTLNFKEADKTSNAFYFLRTEKPENIIRIQLASASFGQTDETVIHLVKGATDQNDSLWDALKMRNGNHISEDLGKKVYMNISSSTSDGGIQYSINSIQSKLDGPKDVPLSITDVTPGTYTLNFSDLSSMTLGYKIILVDTYLNIATEIKDNAAYEFKVDDKKASFGDNRFYLRINGEAIITALEAVDNSMKVYPNPVADKLSISLSDEQQANLKGIVLYNVMGIPVVDSSRAQYLLDPGIKTIDMGEFSSGVYILSVQCGDIIKSTRVIKK